MLRDIDFKAVSTITRAATRLDLPTVLHQQQLIGERHPKLYLVDGDIVLSAKKATDGSIVLFRVDKVLLCRYSAIMKNILSIPSDAAANESYDGFVRVEMPDDAEDLERLLTVLYEPL